MRMLHAIEKAEGGSRTDFSKPFFHFQQFLKRRGIVVVISDFYEQPETIVKVVEPLRYRGNEVVLFHILDPNELEPKFRDPVLLLDVEDETAMEVSPDYARNEYRARMDQHRRALSEKAAAAGLEYVFMNTAKPLDQGLRNYLAFAKGEGSWVSSRHGFSPVRRAGPAGVRSSAAAVPPDAHSVQLAHVLRAAHAEFD